MALLKFSGVKCDLSEPEQVPIKRPPRPGGLPSAKPLTWEAQLGLSFPGLGPLALPLAFDHRTVGNLWLKGITPSGPLGLQMRKRRPREGQRLA